MLPKLFIGADPLKLEKQILKELQTIYPNLAGGLADLFHPEIFIIFKINQETIGIEEVRDFLYFFRHKPVFSSIKTGIIFLADNLTEEAQNILLKYLEEHPTYVNLIMAVQSKQAVLQTIYSRMQPIFVADSNKRVQRQDKYQEEFLKLYNKRDFLKLREFLLANLDQFNALVPVIKEQVLKTEGVSLKEKTRTLELLTKIASWQAVKLPQKQIIEFVIAYLSSIIRQ